MISTPRLSTARAELARRVEHWLELPMLLLGALWLLLLVIQLAGHETSATDTLTTTIWVVFIIEFTFRLAVAPHRVRFLKRNWITALSLVLPAFRVLRVFRITRLLRAGRAVRAVRMARLLTSFNRGMGTLGSTMQNRGFPYVAVLTVIVLLLGAAGIYTFERGERADQAFDTFSGSLWWTAMILTTMGSEYWPRTAEGRLVCLLLAAYAFAVFGYITATLASFFVGSDTADQRDRAVRLEAELAAIRRALETRQ